jgi:hypothetical protein
MKKLFSLILIISCALDLIAQSGTKISAMPSATTPDNAYLPILQLGTNKKIIVDTLLMNKVDSVKMSNDTVYYYKFGSRYVAGVVSVNPFVSATNTGSSLTLTKRDGSFTILNVKPSSTDVITEGTTNLFYTETRFTNSFNSIFSMAFDNRFSVILATKSTSDLVEGSRLYYTDARARAAISMTTTGTGAASYNNATGVINVPRVIGSFGISLDGQGATISTGSKGFVTIPYDCTITNWYVVADASGSIQFDIKRSGSSIIGAGNKPALVSAQSSNAAVSGWTSTAVSAGDIIEWNVDNATTVTLVTLTLKVTK